MKIDILNERYNPFLKRKELVLGIQTPEKPTPSKADIVQAISQKEQKEPDYIEVIKVLSDRGLPKAKAWVFVWDEKRVVKEKKEAKAEGTVQ